MTKQGCAFVSKLKREAASLVLDLSYMLIEATDSLGLNESALRCCEPDSSGRGGITSTSEAVTLEQQKAQESQSPHQPARARKIDFGKCPRALDGREIREFALIDQLLIQEPVDLLCLVFEVTRSCYYSYCPSVDMQMPSGCFFVAV